MASSYSSSAPCPGITCGGKCHGEDVAVRRGRGSRVGIRESRPTLRFAPCSVLLAQGWRGDGHVEWANEAEAGAASMVVRHRDGLVGFRL